MTELFRLIDKPATANRIVLKLMDSAKNRERTRSSPGVPEFPRRNDEPTMTLLREIHSGRSFDLPAACKATERIEGNC